MISLISEIVADARFHSTGNGAGGVETIPLIRKTRSVRDFANFGNRGRFAISLGRETVTLGVGRFRLFGNVVDSRCRYFLETMAGARFRLTGKRSRWPVGDFAYSGNAADARFR